MESWVNLFVKKIILIYIFLTASFNSEVLAKEGWYISPGVQIGIDSRGNLHRSAQITFGLLIEEYPFTTGLTIGYKWLRKLNKSGKKSWNRYNYYDLQSHVLESIIQPGIGFGLIQGYNKQLTTRFKLWSGWLFLPSYEFINTKNDDSKHHFGLFGVLPIPIGVSGI